MIQEGSDEFSLIKMSPKERTACFTNSHCVPTVLIPVVTDLLVIFVYLVCCSFLDPKIRMVWVQNVRIQCFVLRVSYASVTISVTFEGEDQI